MENHHGRREAGTVCGWPRPSRDLGSQTAHFYADMAKQGVY
jgi:hypothetical protein